MVNRPIVAVVRTQPSSVLEDVGQVMEKAQFTKYLDKTKTTILKDNISWHFPFLSANTTPWQLVGVILVL